MAVTSVAREAARWRIEINTASALNQRLTEAVTLSCRSTDTPLPLFLDKLATRCRSIVVFSGAGLSCNSGALEAIRMLSRYVTTEGFKAEAVLGCALPLNRHVNVQHTQWAL
jgi:hypothetical protein